jgi:hypothetical protein
VVLAHHLAHAGTSEGHFSAVPARARIAAAAILLDRGWGKAKEMHEHSEPDSKPIERIVREIVYLPPDGPKPLEDEDEPVISYSALNNTQ